jgi:hypothetical protein
MNISSDDALKSLHELDAVDQATRTVTAYAGVDIVLAAWGLVWIIGFLSSQVLFESGQRTLMVAGGFVWDILVISGIAVTILVFRRSPFQNSAGKRIGIFWGALYGYLWLAMLVMWPFLSREALETPDGAKCIGAISAIVPMFAYVVMGLWLDVKYLVWFGLALTALTLAGFFLCHGVFWIWMAVVCGGAFLGTAVYLRIQCRRAMSVIAKEDPAHA